MKDLVEVKVVKVLEAHDMTLCQVLDIGPNVYIVGLQVGRLVFCRIDASFTPWADRACVVHKDEILDPVLPVEVLLSVGKAWNHGEHKE